MTKHIVTSTMGCQDGCDLQGPECAISMHILYAPEVSYDIYRVCQLNNQHVWVNKRSLRFNPVNSPILLSKVNPYFIESHVIICPV